MRFEKYRIIPIGGIPWRGVSIKITPTRRRRKAGIGYLPLKSRSLPLPIFGAIFSACKSSQLKASGRRILQVVTIFGTIYRPATRLALLF